MNLARTWRPKTFDEIVGQDLTIRILKNSLFRNQLFPVYLLSGQRGCGKTTTGRVFAAAINCAQRPNFVINPQSVVLPCLTCTSCLAMVGGNHPDFIEIDAASHTGVDNVRTLIEGSSFLPILGTYKIYLIDEAHMLSKAAFNAFLKILEEPSANVLFMLATTDAQKIIDTVKSRCFQLFFDSIDQTVLFDHLAAVCKKENIPYEDAGLRALIGKAEGSARDALNILERVRLATDAVTQESVRTVLGIIDTSFVIRLLEVIVTGSLPEVLHFLRDENIHKYAATDVWEQMRGVIRECIWQTQKCSQGLSEHADEIKVLAVQASVQRWVGYLELLYDAELAFNKASVQHDVLQLIFIKMAQGVRPASFDTPLRGIQSERGPHAEHGVNERGIRAVQQVQDKLQAGTNSQLRQDTSLVNSTPIVLSVSEGSVLKEKGSPTAEWFQFLEKVSIGDPLLFSLFKQGKAHALDNNNVRVEFPLKLQFFKEKFIETKAFWQPLLEQCYGKVVTITPSFIADVSEIKKVSHVQQAQSERSAGMTSKVIEQKQTFTGEKAQMLTRIFPGTIQEIKEN